MNVTKLMMAGVLGSALVMAPLVHAQTTPAKPAAKPAATKPAVAKPATTASEGKTMAIGNGSGSGPILSRDELRACFKQEASVRSRIPESDARRVALDKEKAGFTTEQEALKADRAGLDDTREGDALRARIAAFAVKAEDLNKRVGDFELAKRQGPQADRLRAILDRERAEMDAERKTLEADAEKSNTASKERIASFNTRIAAMDARVSDWNARNSQLNKDAETLEDDRLAWVQACQNRRYREDDEIAIRGGK